MTGCYDEMNLALKDDAFFSLNGDLVERRGHTYT